MSRLTPTDITIAKERAKGKTLQQIADTIPGAPNNKGDVSRKINKNPDIKALIERIQNRVINSAASQAADNIIHAVTSYKSKGIKKDPQLRDHGYKASVQMMQGMGILPSHTQSQMIININNAGQMVISEDILNILKGLPKAADLPGDVIDIDTD